MSPDKNKKPNVAVLLAVLVDIAGISVHPRIPRELALRLRAVLEKRSRALAAAFGEHMACYDSVHDAARAAAALQDVLEDALPHYPNMAGVYSRAVIELWPESALGGAALGGMRELLARASGPGVLLTEAARAQLDAATAAAAQLQPAGAERSAQGYEPDLLANPMTYREATRLHGERPAASYGAVILTRLSREWRVMPAQCPFTFGRDKGAGMTLGGPNVSRIHGRITHESGVFYYGDDSRNGTYLITGGEEAYLHGARFQLMGKGVISPGEPLEKQTGEVVRFRCEAVLDAQV